MDQHLVTLFHTLDQLAGVSDAIVAAEAKAEAADHLSELLERSDALRVRLAEASARFQAAGSPFPGGADGAALVALMKSCNERIRVGDLACGRIILYRNTLDAFSEAYALQTIVNLPAIAAHPSVARLGNAFAGKPALLVAAGPSLDKNIDVIRRFKGKAVIIAVSHALGALERAGIVPDLVIAIDPEDLLHHFDGALVPRVEALVMATSCNPRVFELPAQRFVTFGANAGVDTWAYEGLETAIAVPTGGSVANSAFSLLSQWGCNPIMLAGQDLSFPDGRYYASATCDGNARFELSADGQSGRTRDAGEGTQKLVADSVQRVRRVPGYHGGEVVTDYAFSVARDWLIAAARELEGKVTLLNCTEGGAYIDGMEHVPLEEAAARYLTDEGELSVGKVLDDAARGLDPEARRRTMLARVKEMRATVQRGIQRATECRTLATKAKRRPELVAKLNKEEAALSASIKGVEFLAILIQREIRGAMATVRAQGVSAEEGLDASIRMYEAIARVLQRARPFLALAEEKLADPARASSAA